MPKPADFSDSPPLSKNDTPAAPVTGVEEYPSDLCQKLSVFCPHYYFRAIRASGTPVELLINTAWCLLYLTVVFFFVIPMLITIIDNEPLYYFDLAGRRKRIWALYDLSVSRRFDGFFSETLYGSLPALFGWLALFYTSMFPYLFILPGEHAYYKNKSLPRLEVRIGGVKLPGALYAISVFGSAGAAVKMAVVWLYPFIGYRYRWCEGWLNDSQWLKSCLKGYDGATALVETGLPFLGGLAFFLVWLSVWRLKSRLAAPIIRWLAVSLGLAFCLAGLCVVWPVNEMLRRYFLHIDLGEIILGLIS